MVTGSIISRIPRTVVTRSLISRSCHENQHLIPHLRHCFHSLTGSQNKVIASQTGLQNPILNSNTFQRFGISSSSSRHFKINVTSQNEREITDISNDSKESRDAGYYAKTNTVDPKEGKESGSNEEHLSMEDMAKLIAENIKLLKTNQEKIEQMNERLHRACAEMENLKERITKEEKNSKKAGAQTVDQHDAIKDSQSGRSMSNQQITNGIIGACVYNDYLEHHKRVTKEESIKHKHDEPKDEKLDVEVGILTSPNKVEISNEDLGSDTSNGDSGSPTSNGDSGSYASNVDSVSHASNVDSSSHISSEAWGHRFYHIYF